MKVVLSGPIKGVSKSYALWVERGVTSVPIVFLRKPKWVTNNDAWVQFIRGAFTAIGAEGPAALNEKVPYWIERCAMTERYESRASTHADDCWSWGPAHYECAVAEIERLREALEEIRSRSSINLAMRPNPFALTAELGNIHQIADAAIDASMEKEVSND